MTNKLHRAGYLLSSIAGLLAVVLFRRNLAAEATMVNYLGFLPHQPLQSTLHAAQVQDLFSHPLVGLVYFDFFDVVNVVLIALMFVSVLAICFKRSRISAFAGTLALLLIVSLYVLSNRGIGLLLNRSDEHALAQMLDAMSVHRGIGNVALFLFYSFGLYITITMLRLKVFSRYTFGFGLLTNAIGLLYFPLMLVGSRFDYLAIVLSAPFTIAWHTNIALNLLKERRKLALP